MKRSVVVVPTVPARAHYLKLCLDYIRETGYSNIIVGIDHRGIDDEALEETRRVVESTNAVYCHIPYHGTYGNTLAVMTLLKAAYDGKFGYNPDVVHYVEDDVMVKPEAFLWANRMHERYPESFAACGWVCNLQGPIDEDDYALAWYYAPFASFRREMLAKVVEHCKPEYFENMRRYVLKTFPDSILHNYGQQTQTKFFEQDGLCQYILERDKQVCMWRRTALCHHIGAHGYNRPEGPVFTGTLDERVIKVETLLANPHLRAQMFGRAIVEREIGGPIPRRFFRYRINLPGDWQSDLTSELEIPDLPRRMNSSDCHGAVIEHI